MINIFILDELFDEINKYEKATREAKWKQDAKIIIKVNLNCYSNTLSDPFRENKIS